MRTLCGVALLAGVTWLVAGCADCCHKTYYEKPSKVQPTDLSSQQWEHRMLLIFAPSQGDERLVTQKAFLAGHEESLASAQVQPIQVIGNGPIGLAAPGEKDTQARDLRARFGVFDEMFTVILVGKDGTTRARSAEPLTVQQVLRAANAPPLDTPKSRAYGVAPSPGSGSLLVD